ncbi:MAG: hypothetical protein GXY42_00430 [Desulfovibrionales bacterium]|nr:hypothetical protein [Desulfovibrionales bacterium]
MFEKRQYPRHASLERCGVEHFLQKDEFTFESRIINYSAGGLMLESDYPLPEWTPVRIRLNHGSDVQERTGNGILVGVVRWCAEQDGSYSGSFGIGVAFAKQTTH